MTSLDTVKRCLYHAILQHLEAVTPTRIPVGTTRNSAGDPQSGQHQNIRNAEIRQHRNIKDGQNIRNGLMGNGVIPDGISVMAKVLKMRQGARFQGDATALNPTVLQSLTKGEKAWVRRNYRGLFDIANSLPVGERIYEKTLVQVFNMDTTVAHEPRVYVSLHPKAHWAKHHGGTKSVGDFRTLQQQRSKAFA